MYRGRTRRIAIANRESNGRILMSNLAQSNQSSLQLNTVEDMQKLSEVLAKSGFFDDAKSAAQCFVKVLAGVELGFPAFASMTGIHIVKGKPAIGANLMAAKVKGSGKYDYKVKTLTEDLCEIEFFEGKEPIGISSFSKKDALNAQTQNMAKFARNMLFARAMSNGVRFYCPDVFFGASVYTPEELGAEVDDQGDVIDITALTPPVTVRDWSQVKEWTEFTSEQIKNFALALKLPPSPKNLTEEQSDALFKCVLANWGWQAFPTAFKAYSHAANALNKVAEANPECSDKELMDAWVADAARREGEALEPEPDPHDALSLA
jgi:hypothetical protein